MCADDESYVVVPRAETRRHGVSACDERVDDSPLPMRQEPLHQERHGTLPITQRVGKQMAMKATKKQRQIIEDLFDNPWAEDIYGGNIHTYIKEVERINDMTDEELRTRYPTAYYWIDKWRKEQQKGK